MPYIEDLSDRQAAEAGRSRLAWKDALSVELPHAGGDRTVLSECRTRLVAGAAKQRRLDALLEHCRTRTWLQARGRQRTDATHVLARVRAVKRLEGVGATLRHALNSLAVVAPAWMQVHCPAAGGTRYGRQVADDHLPTTQEERQAYAQVIGTDGHTFLAALDASQAPPWFGAIPAVET
jgi:transposase